MVQPSVEHDTPLLFGLNYQDVTLQCDKYTVSARVRPHTHTHAHTHTHTRNTHTHTIHTTHTHNTHNTHNATQQLFTGSRQLLQSHEEESRQRQKHPPLLSCFVLI